MPALYHYRGGGLINNVLFKPTENEISAPILFLQKFVINKCSQMVFCKSKSVLLRNQNHQYFKKNHMTHSFKWNSESKVMENHCYN